ncbi:probable peptidoglycan muropeptide transporter SLC46 [Panulirus ornatus]|uniref:probable peptidoglycan muropeptide transporter SLC46 n=1 Tax=Panulirus ornatus TaxID=150431 RepID=UPI003A842E90
MDKEQEVCKAPPAADEEKSEVSRSLEEPKARMGIRAALCLFLSGISIEPMLFVKALGDNVMKVILQKLKVERFCTVSLNYTEEECLLMDDGNHTDMQMAAQVLDNDFSFYETAMSSIPLLILVFLGSWSDKHGRKVPMCLCILGYILYSGVYLLEAIFTSWPAQVLLVGVFLRSCGGGFQTFLMVAYSFISDRTSIRARTSRMALMNAVWQSGWPAGTLLGAWIYDTSGYVAVFGTSLALHTFCALYVIIILEDKIPKDESVADDSGGHKCSCKSAFDLQHVVEVTRTAFKSRPGRGRPHLLIVMSMMLLQISAYLHNTYLWSRLVLGWDQDQYSLWTTVTSTFHQVALLCVSPFLVMVHDCVAGAVQCAFSLLEDLWVAFVTRPDQWWVMYASIVVSMAPSVTSIAIRSTMSKICDKDEVGKVFSLLAIMETIYPIADKALYVAVYDATIDTYPSAQHFVSSFFYLLLVVSFISLRISMSSVERKRARAANDTSL